MNIKIFNNDFLSWSEEYEGGSAGAFLADPPYFLSLFGKANEWDKHGGIENNINAAKEWGEILNNHLKPGALGLMFSSPRTQHYLAVGMEMAGFRLLDCLQWVYSSGMSKSISVDKLTDDEAWKGYRTPSLKTAYEPILLFQAPSYGMTFAELAKNHGTGSINVNGTRIPIEDYVSFSVQRQSSNTAGMNGIGKSGYKSNHVQNMYNEDGRFPSNFLLDDSIDDLEIKKYFFVSKPSQKEKFAGTTKGNTHPTVKPISLAQYLATLLLPPDSVKDKTLLIPFSGSGSEVIGSMLAGWNNIVGIEQDKEYCDLAEQRISWWKANSEVNDVKQIVNKATKGEGVMSLL